MRTRRGLTLVELLVVIAIIAVLAGLFFVGGRWAIASAKTAACASNLRQGAKALALYAADHDDLFPPYFWGGLPAAYPWPDPVQTLLVHEVAFLSAMGRYGWIEDLRFCPLDPFARKDLEAEFGRHLHSSYHLSLDVRLRGVNHRGAWIFSPSLVDDPAGIPLLHDLTRMEPDPEVPGRRVRRSAHGVRFNVVFLDGHTKLLPTVDPDL